MGALYLRDGTKTPPFLHGGIVHVLFSVFGAGYCCEKGAVQQCELFHFLVVSYAALACFCYSQQREGKVVSQRSAFMLGMGTARCASKSGGGGCSYLAS